MDDSLAAARRRFADKIAKRQKITDARLIEAFAGVPRERYLGPGPWMHCDGLCLSRRSLN